MASAKNAAICGILQRFLGPPLYIGSIAAFFVTAAKGIVFCSVLQCQDNKPPQYVCISGIYINIAALQNPTAINISFSADTIAIV